MGENKVNFTLRLPSLETNRSYSDRRREWKCYVNGIIKQVTTESRDIDCNFRVGTKLEVMKTFSNRVDSTFTYIVGEEHATLEYKEIKVKLKAFLVAPNGKAILKAIANDKITDQSRIIKNKK